MEPGNWPAVFVRPGDGSRHRLTCPPEVPNFMRLRLALFCLFAFPIAASADSYYLTIAGSVGSFRTDVRIFNPSSSDSNVSLVFVPVGNQNNGAAFFNSVNKVIPKG